VPDVEGNRTKRFRLAGTRQEGDVGAQAVFEQTGLKQPLPGNSQLGHSRVNTILDPNIYFVSQFIKSKTKSNKQTKLNISK
jgi:hypothetical protein